MGRGQDATLTLGAGMYMSQPAATIAATMSALLFLLRDQPARREEQAHAFRAFLTAVGDGDVSVRISDTGLEIGGEPISTAMPGAAELADHLRGHGVQSLRFLSGMTPPDILSVLRALATPVGRFDSLDHLIADIDPGARVRVEIAGAGRDAGGLVVEPTRGLISSDTYLAESTPVEHVGSQYRASVERPAPDQVQAMLAQLAESPEGGESAVLLDHVIAAADAAMQARDYDTVLDVAAAIARIESGLPEGETRRAHQLALRRLLSYGFLEQVARRTAGARKQDAIEVLRRSGTEASDMLLQQLVESDSMEQRRAYYNALRQLATASPLLGRLLTHDEWFVVRNVAELCGELRADDTVPQLSRHVNHSDERVRRAVAGALGKIGTPATIEPLRQFLRDPSPQVRLQAAQGVEGPRARGLAMSLALALEEETNGDVVRELVHALGRIGSVDAVQALAKAAAPGRRLFNRRPVATRLAAVDALRVAGSPPAATALQGLLGDDEAEVRAAAERALGAMGSPRA